MATYLGLNLRFLLNDIFDRDEALINLGINREDLERISGLSNSLQGGDSTPREDMRALTNLDLDQEKELYALRISGESIQNNVIGIRDVGQTLNVDIIQDGARLVSGAIKYNYLDLTNLPSTSGGTKTILQADISTSRVSSWSSTASPATDTSPIFYGGDVKIQDSDIVYDGQLKVLEAPELVRYEAETPTHVVSININGTPQKFLAMKGIPLQFDTFFRNADLHLEVNYIKNAQNENIRPVWRVVNLDNSGRVYENTNPPLGIGNPWRFRDVQNRPRTVELYYNPLNITKLHMRSMNIQEWPQVPMDNLRYLDIMFNDFYQLPDLATNAPNLEELYIQGNNMSRSGVSANTQLNSSLNPSKLRILDMDGVFSDSTAIDLTAFSALTTLSMDAYYRSRSARQMTGGTYTPSVWSTGSGATRNTVIDSYSVRHQPYTRIPESVNEANSLRYLNIWACNITGVGSNNAFITLENADNLTHIYSYSNNHNFIDVSNKEFLIWYYHIWSSLRDTDGLGGIDGRYIDGKLSGCIRLQYFIPTGSNLYVKDESAPLRAFQTLDALRYVDLRWTQMAGYFDHQSFTGTGNLRNLYIRHGRWNPNDDVNYQIFNETGGAVFGENTPNFYYLIVEYNKRIRGQIPDFSKNGNLRVVVLQGTKMSGSIPSFSSNRNLGYIYIRDNEFTGNVPAFSGTQFLYIYLNDNNLDGQIEPLNCPNLYRLYAYGNNLSGPVPTFGSCTRIEEIRLQNNSLGRVAKGVFKSNTYLKVLELSNNLVDTDSAVNIIDDLLNNYETRPRGGVSVNLQGNPIDANAITSNPKVVEQLETLKAAGWSISF